MLATVRADFYRLFRTKGFWISQVLIILFIFVTIASQSVGKIGVNTPEMEQTTSSFSDFQWTGVVSVNAVTSMLTFFFYCMLPLLIIIVGHDFTKQTYKNILTVGVSRTKYFLSQYFSFAFIILLQVFYIYLVSFLTGTLFYGAGEGFGSQQVKDWLFTGLVQFLMIMAVMTVSCLVTYLTKNNVLAIIVAILFPILISVLSVLFTDLTWLSNFDFQNIMADSNFILSGIKEIGPSIMAACGTILVFLGITIWQFNKIEL